MKKLLIQFDTDERPSAFDTVVAYDGGADHVVGYAGCTPGTVPALVEGAIFTRSAANKRYTAIFIGGGDLVTGDALLDAVKKMFFQSFRVSVMLDCNGCNTTAAAAVASVLRGGVEGKKAVILAGTGPVGSRAAVMLARSGANVAVTSRTLSRSVQTCRYLKDRFGVDVTPVEAAGREDRAAAIRGAHIVLSTGAAGVPLLDEADWRNLPELEVILDANAVPPAGVGGVKMNDRGEPRHGKTAWGALGFGAMKLKLQRRCIGGLFEQNDRVLDVDEIFNLAREMI